MGTRKIGMLARSKAGHDKGQVFLIVGEDDTYVYLVDGKVRRLDNPKKKKHKHIQPIQRQYNIEGMDDVAIKRILKVYGKEIGGE